MIISLLLIAVTGLIPLAAGHAAIFHPSMWGFNVTQQTFPYDNRPVSPLTNYTFKQWWFHGHLDYPPHDGDFFELPAGKPATAQVACDKGATTFYASDPGGNIQDGDNACPGSPIAAIHTTGASDLKGCALAITYNSNVSSVEPEDFAVFSVNQSCVWTRFTDFQVPARMPPCPEGGCICAFFWIHSQDSGGEQNYMNGFRCNVTESNSNVALATPQVARRCGADPVNGRPDPTPGNCTYGAKQPLYWFQAERNNMFEGTYSPPFYNDLYNYLDGAQEDIFVDSYPNGIPSPGPNQTLVPTPNLGGIAATLTPFAPSTVSLSSSTILPFSSSTRSPASISSPAAPSASVSSATVSSTGAPVSSASAPVSSASPSGPTSSSTAPVSSNTLSPSVIITTSTETVVSTLVVTVSVTATDLPTSVSTQITPSSSPSGGTAVVVPTIILNRPSNTTAISSVSAAQASASVTFPAALLGFTQESGNVSIAQTTSVPQNTAKCQSTISSRRLRRRSASSGLELAPELVRPNIVQHRTARDRRQLWRLF